MLSTSGLSSNLKYLLNLINLRKFDESIVDKIKAMPITADIRDGVVYQYAKREIENNILNTRKAIEDKVKNVTLKKVASNMFKEGFALDIISKATDIPIEDLKKFFKVK